MTSRRASQKKGPPVPKKTRITEALIGLALPRIIFTLRSAAKTDLERITHRTELESRMISELGHYGELTMTSLVRIVGQDKSQVSRALRRLLAAKLIKRETLRSPLKLTPKGQGYFVKLERGLHEAERFLLGDFNRGEQSQIMSGIARLRHGASHLLEREYRLGGDRPGLQSSIANPLEGIPEIEPGITSGILLPQLVIPRMVALVALLQRSASLAFKRLAQLTSFEAVVLAYIWEYSPVSSKHVSQLTGRRKSQVDRTAAALADLKLIHRTRSHSSHDWILDRSKSGSKVYKKWVAETHRREAVLLENFSAAEIKRFRALTEKLAANANQMLLRDVRVSKKRSAGSR